MKNLIFQLLEKLIAFGWDWQAIKPTDCPLIFEAWKVLWAERLLPSMGLLRKDKDKARQRQGRAKTKMKTKTRQRQE